LGGNITLSNVIFDDFDCGDALRINSECVCQNVTIVGRRPTSLFVRPGDDVTLDSIPTNDLVAFDISRFTGEVEIIGYAGREVKKDVARHVSIYSNWKTEVDWKKLGIEGLSFWHITMQKAEDGNAGRGVFSLPSPKSKKYQKIIEQRALLEEAGLCFE